MAKTTKKPIGAGELFWEYTSEIKIYLGQVKSLEKAKKICGALTILEEEMCIHSTRLYIEWCFFCPDIDLSQLGNTPMEILLREIILDLRFSWKWKQ